jgi:hypothetical protein
VKIFKTRAAFIAAVGKKQMKFYKGKFTAPTTCPTMFPSSFPTSAPSTNPTAFQLPCPTKVGAFFT